MHTELLAPAGDFETALAAFDAGADAVYCGLADFSARAFAKNFSPDDLRALMRVARRLGRKVYVTFNTLIDEADLPAAVERLALLDGMGVDAVIVQDLGVARICRERFPRLALHASTQLFAHNLESVLALKEIGFRRVVLARELTLEEVASIAKRSGVEIECFIHGALCYSISGLCLFSAMEKGRSGNRGRCAYCCRLPFGGALPFSMKDLRLGEDALALADASVASLKIEGRMKSALYVASAVKYYREILDGSPRTVSEADLETVFSRRTTPLYLRGRRDDVIEPSALGHLGTPIGTVKRITRDREGVRWIRFHTSRAIERHDGLQFLQPQGGKPVGFGISAMRTALSRSLACTVAAGEDVEVFLPETVPDGALSGGETVYLSMSNAVKRRFPAPAFRSSEYPGVRPLAVKLTLAPDAIAAESGGVRVERHVRLEAAKNAGAAAGAAEKAFSRLGETDYHLASLEVDNPGGLFAPASVLNELRRELVVRVAEAERRAGAERLAAALAAIEDEARAAKAGAVRSAAEDGTVPPRYVKLRSGQLVPPGDWREIIVEVAGNAVPEFRPDVRIALPVFTPEAQFNRLRVTVKNLLRQGFTKFEAADIAGLRLLRSLGVEDVSADWSLYAMNSQALAELTRLGVRRFTASPENGGENMRALAASGYDIEFLEKQSTPLFISLHRPAFDGKDGCPDSSLAWYAKGPLWVTTRSSAHVFQPPHAAPLRLDLSWDPA